MNAKNFDNYRFFIDILSFSHASYEKQLLWTVACAILVRLYGKDAER